MPHVGSTFDWWLERVHPADRDRFAREVRTFLQSGDRQAVLQYRLRRSGGDYVPVTDRVAVERGGDGTPIRLVALVEERIEAPGPQPRTPYEVLVEHTTDPVYIVGASGHLRDFNPAFLELLDLTEQAASGRCMTDFLQGKRDFESIVAGLRDRGEMSEVEVAVVGDDGRVRPVRLTAVATLGSEGEYLGHHGFLRPSAEANRGRGLATLRRITERLARADDLDSTTLRDIIDTLALGCHHPELVRVSLELDGRSITDGSFDEASAMSFPITVGAADEEPLGRVSISYLNGGGSRGPRFEPAEADFLAEVAARVGEAARRIREARSPTARQSVTEEPRDRMLVERSRDLLAIIDAHGAIRVASAAAEGLLGYEPGSLAGMKALELVHPSDVDGIRGAIDRANAGSSSVGTVRHRVRHADGSWRQFETLGQAFLDDPDIQGIVLNCRDITEQTIVEQQLAHSQRMEAVGRLAGGVAHEFNNLLTVIRVSAQLLQDDLGLDDPPEELKTISDAAIGASALTRRLVAFSGRGVVKPRPLDLGELVTAFRPVLGSVLGSRVRLEVRRSPSVLPVMADAYQVEHAILELCENARDAMPHGGDLSVEVRMPGMDDLPFQFRRRRDWVMLIVSDTGTGIPDDVRDRIFDPFFSTKGGSGGLGLTTVRDIVSRLGGLMEVSTSGAGTTFRLFLPTIRGEDRVSNSVGASEVSREEPCSGTILLVEADPATRSVAECALKGRGYCVLEAEHGVAALTLVDAYRGSLDLLVTALDVPDLDAEALAARVLALHPGARVLYLGSARSDGPEGPFLPADAPPGRLVEAVDALLSDPTDHA